jgi:hypothetical protein
MALGLSSDEVSQLVRINSTLNTWLEHECNGDIERDDDTGKCYWVRKDPVQASATRLAYSIYNRSRTPDRETGALKRAQMIADWHELGFYYQSDCRGVQVHIYDPNHPLLADNPIDSCYPQVSVAVYRPS